MTPVLTKSTTALAGPPGRASDVCGPAAGPGQYCARRAHVPGQGEVPLGDIDRADVAVAPGTEQRDGGETESSRAEEHHGLIRFEGKYPVDRAVGGQTRTGQRCSPTRVETLDVHEVLLIGHENVFGVAAVAGHAQVSSCRTTVVVAFAAVPAFAAADPRVDQPHVTHANGFDVVAHLFDDADHLVAEHHRVLDAAVLHTHQPATAQIVSTGPQVGVGVADAGPHDFQKDLRPAGLGVGIFRSWIVLSSGRTANACIGGEYLVQWWLSGISSSCAQVPGAECFTSEHDWGGTKSYR